MTTPTATVALLQAVRGCTLCAVHLPHGPRPLLQLDPRARILVAGQAPGRRAHERGVPFDDPSGDRLRRWMGLDRVRFYDARLVAIVPMGLCYPGSGPSGDLPPRPECAPRWREALLRSLPQLKLTLVIGRHALAGHLPHLAGLPLSDIVHGWNRHAPDLLPLPHPSPRNQAWLRARPWFERDRVPELQLRVRAALAASPGDRAAPASAASTADR